MSKTASFQDIKNHINKDIQSCDTLLRLLDSERQALKDRKPDDLEHIISEKVIHLQNLENSAQQRSLWISTQNTNGTSIPSESQEQLWLKLIERSHKELPALWETLQGKFKTCQTQNEINGKILARNQQVFKRILSILRGKSEPQQNLYNQLGSNSNHNVQQTLGEA